jgi:CelD/BcsL family acetyltransferase involved in cellulose biosynthesis
MSLKTSTSTAQSVADDNGEDTLNAADSQAMDDTPVMDGNSQPQSSTEDASGCQPSQGKLPLPLQKRRRVTRACDECRRKKIKVSAGVERPHTSCLISVGAFDFF